MKDPARKSPDLCLLEKAEIMDFREAKTNTGGLEASIIKIAHFLGTGKFLAVHKAQDLAMYM